MPVAQGVLAEGTFYFDRFVAGSPTGAYVKLPGIATLEVKANSEIVEVTTKDRGQYNQVLASATVPKPADVTLKFSAVSPAAMAMALQGDLSDFAQGSGSVADAALTAALGKYKKLGYRNIASAGLTVKDTTGATTYTLGQDYTINYGSGLIYFPAGSAMTEGQDLKVSFSYNALSSSKITFGTNATIRGGGILDGSNLMDGLPLGLEFFELSLGADAGVDWMSDKPVELSLKGRMITPDGKTTPMEVLYGQILS